MTNDELMDNGLTKNVFWLWFQDSGNFLCQILIFVSNSNFSYVLQQFFSPYGLTDCDSAPQLPAWWYVNDICWLYMAIIHISPACICTCMFCHYPVFTFSLVRTELGMLLYALRLQDQLHGFTVRDRLSDTRRIFITIWLMLDQTGNWSSLMGNYWRSICLTVRIHRRSWSLTDKIWLIF